MNKHKLDIALIIILFFSAVIFSIDPFLHKGQFANFDGNTHSVTIAQFFRALKDGDMKVTWADGFTKYGFAIPIFSQQVTSYAGALINFVTNNITVSIHLLYMVAAIASVLGMYWFFRLYFSEQASFVGAFLCNIATYRIINLYVRSALPEFFASMWIPFICISIHYVMRNNFRYFFLLILSTVALILTHPMMLIVYSFFIGAYVYAYVLKEGFEAKKWLFLGIAAVWALLISGYYIIPLIREIKYFNYGNVTNHYEPNHHLTLAQFVSPRWPYFYRDDIYTRGNFLKIGEVEFMLTAIAAIISLHVLRKKKQRTIQDYFFITGSASSLLVMYLLSPHSVWVFKLITFLSNIQYPWRLLSVFTVFPPFFIAYLLDMSVLSKNKIAVSLIIIGILCVLRFPQLYGKNYTYYDQSTYFSIPNNIHIAGMNTPWTSRIEDYPIKKNRLEIIEGKAKILTSLRKNSWRQYEINAESPLRLVEYSFYFPGWKVYVDGNPTLIEFQDINYRGILTFRVPAGKHIVKIAFEDTKVRAFGLWVSIISSVLFVCFFLFFKQFMKFAKEFSFQRVHTGK